jgi:rare lipoprotein A (peptidoglycan hydrolase)
MTLLKTGVRRTRSVGVDICILPGLAWAVPPRPTRMRRQQSGTTPICFPPAHPIPLAWPSDRASPKRDASKRRLCRMHMRRTIGVSLAFLVISTSAMAKTPEKSASHHPGHGQQHGAKPQRPVLRICQHQTVSSRGTHSRSPVRYLSHHAASRHRHSAPPAAANNSGGGPDRYLAPAREFGGREIGKAAWYNLVGGYTSTGERLDTVTATAAHRTLPLSSYAKVTNLDTGRSVIVRINDRGPWTRRFIIDLSPRAADALDMKRAGVASVTVEPISAETVGAKPTVATYRSSGTPVTQ